MWPKERRLTELTDTFGTTVVRDCLYQGARAAVLAHALSGANQPVGVDVSSPSRTPPQDRTCEIVRTARQAIDEPRFAKDDPTTNGSVNTS